MSPLWILCLVVLAVGALVVAWAARDTAAAVVDLHDACDGLRQMSDELGHARAEADVLHARLAAMREARSAGAVDTAASEPGASGG